MKKVLKIGGIVAGAVSAIAVAVVAIMIYFDDDMLDF